MSQDTVNMNTVPLTAVVQRRIKPGAEERFEALMQQFIAEVLRQPGHVGINVFRQPGDSRAYTVVDRFATQEDRRRFTASSEYQEWMRRLREVSDAEPVIEEMNGLSFWFNLPNRPARRPPSKVKMSFVTLLGVYPLTMIFPAILVPLTGGWPAWLRGLLIAALIVVSLTWLVMPFMTRLFERWLFHSDREG